MYGKGMPGMGLPPQADMQRNSIAQALMNIRNPPGGFNTGLPGQEPGWEAPMPPPQVEPPFQVSGATSPPIPQRDVSPGLPSMPGAAGPPWGSMPGGTPPLMGRPSMPPMDAGVPQRDVYPMGGWPGDPRSPR